MHPTHPLKDGSLAPITVMSVPMFAGGDCLGLFLILVDRRQQLRARRTALRRERRRRRTAADLQPLFHQQHVVRENERLHLAREIHDELGQLLTAISLAVHAMPPSALRDERVAELTTRLAGLAQASMDTLHEAVQHALRGERYVSSRVTDRLVQTLSRPRPAGGLLSPREREVLRLLGSGARTSEIATRLGVSAKTVSTYKARIQEKLELRNTAELVRYAVTNGLFERS